MNFPTIIEPVTHPMYRYNSPFGIVAVSMKEIVCFKGSLSFRVWRWKYPIYPVALPLFEVVFAQGLLLKQIFSTKCKLNTKHY